MIVGLIFVLVLPVITLCYPDQWLHQIYVDNQTGVNDSSCWEGGYSTPCLSLNLALIGAQYHYDNSTIIHLQPGQHQLRSGSETRLRNMSQLAIVGNGSQGEVVIRCEPLVGLAFFWSEIIEIKNVSLIECGAQHHNTSGCKSQIAILFTSCELVELRNDHISDSNGTGVVINNTAAVYVNQCLFSYNGLPDSQQEVTILSHGGAGGLVIEANGNASESFFMIANSTFTHNTASSGQFSDLSGTTNPSEYFGLGRGGGISMVFRGGAVNNTVQLSSVWLTNNKAEFGGGLFIGFYGRTRDNTVTLFDIQIAENKAAMLKRNNYNLLRSANGGGIFLTLAASGHGATFPANNTVTISSSSLSLNTAIAGGGLAVGVACSGHGCKSAGNKLVIENCTFANNTAFQGASAYMSQCSKGVLDTTVCSSSFNYGHCSALRNNFGTYCLGNVLVEHSSLTFQGSVMFVGVYHGNYTYRLSALSLRFSSIELLRSTQVQFINNSAFNGGAIHLVDCSAIVVNDYVTLLFKNNSAINRGGAIYAESCHLGQTNGRDCIVRHSVSTLHPNSWNINVTFIGNKEFFQVPIFSTRRVVYRLSSIFLNSIQSCVWQKTDSPSDTFCWRGWVYSNSGKYQHKKDCVAQLRSNPTYFNYTGPFEFTVTPGEYIQVQRDNIGIYDDWGNEILQELKENLQLKVVNGPAIVQNSETLVDQEVVSIAKVELSCHTKNFSKTGSLLYLNFLHFPGIFITVYFNPCENGWTCPNVTIKCNPPSRHDVDCHWTQCTLNHSHGACPYSFVNISGSYASCAQHREGVLCGRCSEGHGVVINHPDLVCTECRYSGVAAFLFVQLVPVLVMMILVAVLHINITNSYIDGFVLYSQMVTLQFPGLGYTSWVPSIRNAGCGFSDRPLYYFMNRYLLSIPLTVYSIWNLNFLNLYPEPFSIPYVDTAAKVIMLQYTTAVCPLMFIAVTYTWVRWYNNGYRIVVYSTRPVHQLLACFWQRLHIQPSLNDTYAGLILLSYMRFLDVSIKLLQFTFVNVTNEKQAFNYSAFYYDANMKYFGLPHAVYGALAIVCLLIFVLAPITVTLFYHLKSFQQCLTLCNLDRPVLHAPVNAYQGCFKNMATDGSERRYFAGIYLLFRFGYVTYMLSYPFSGSQPLLIYELCLSLLMAALIIVLQPYKKRAHNFINILLVLFMAGLTIPTLIPYTSPTALYVNVSLMYIPFLALSIYILFKLYCATVHKKKNAVNEQLPRIKTSSEEALIHEPVPVTTSTLGISDSIDNRGVVYGESIAMTDIEDYNKKHTQYELLHEN